MDILIWAIFPLFEGKLKDSGKREMLYDVLKKKMDGKI